MHQVTVLFWEKVPTSRIRSDPVVPVLEAEAAMETLRVKVSLDPAPQKANRNRQGINGDRIASSALFWLY